MKNQVITQFTRALVVAMAVSSVASAAEAVKWNAPLPDQPALLEKSTQVDAPIINRNHEAVSFSYAIDSSQPLDFSAPVHVEKSRQYWLDTTGEKLAAGLKLPVTGGQTVVRISPLNDDKQVAINAAQVSVLAAGRSLPLDVFADAQSLKKTGVPFSENSVAFKAQLPAGQALLKVSGLGDKVPVVVHVFEPESTQVLELATAKATVNANEPLRVTARLNNLDSPQTAQWQGYVSLPDGRVAGELKFTRQADGSYQASLPLGTLTGLANGLWQVHVFASNDKVMRDAQTAFAVNLPVAAFNGQLALKRNQAGAAVQVGVKVARAGRYEVRGVLFGRDASNKAVPFGVTMTAAWLTPGDQQLALPLKASLLAKSGLKAPFEIRQVQLMDQSRLAPVQTIGAGLTIEDLPAEMLPSAAGFARR